MAYDISYSMEPEMGPSSPLLPRATVWLRCDKCQHGGTARYDWQRKSKFWWLVSISNEDDGRPDFVERPERGDGNIHHCDEVVFAVTNLVFDPYAYEWSGGSGGQEYSSRGNHPHQMHAAFPPSGKTITLLRKIARMSRGQLARESGIDRRFLKAIERGEVAVSAEIAEALKSVLEKRNGASVVLLSPLDSGGSSDYIWKIWIQQGEVLGRIKSIEEKVYAIAAKLQA